MEIDEKVIDVLIVDRVQLSVKLQQLHERNSQTDQETLDHVLSLNQTLHQKLIQLHSSLNTSSSRFNFSLSQQMDAFADVLTTLCVHGTLCFNTRSCFCCCRQHLSACLG